MKTPVTHLFTLVCLLLLWVVSCKKSDDPVTPKSTAKDMTAFAFNGLTPAVNATVDATAKTVMATVPYGTDVTKLVPSITVSAKATVSPASGVAQDFTKTVTYTLTAEDGTTSAYAVTIGIGAPPKSTAKDITAFAFNGLSPAVTCAIDGTTKTISATLPAGTDATKLVPTITLSPKATVSPATGVAQDFSKAVTYTVTAEDGSTQAYSATITAPPAPAVVATVTTNSATDILTTSANISGTISKAGSAQVTAYGHCWSSTSQTPTVADTKTTLTAAGNFPLDFKSSLSGLQSNTTYYVRAYATSAAGTAYSAAVTFKTSDASDALNVITGIKMTILRGDAYSSDDQQSFVNLTTGKVYKFSEGAANAANIDLVVKLFSNSVKYTGDDVQIYSPAKELDDDKYWGDFVTKYIAQNWSAYKGTKLARLNQTDYPWAKTNTSTDLASVIKNSYVSLSSSSYTIMSADGTVSDDKIYIFQTKEGKQGILRITDGSKKADSYTVTLDIKVQK